MFEKTLKIINIILIVLLLGGFLYFNRVISPYNKVRDDTYSHVRDYAGIKNPDNFYVYHGISETYFTVLGQDARPEYVVAIVEQNTGNIDVFLQSEVLSEADVVRAVEAEYPVSEMMSQRIGKEDDTPIWEVTFKDNEGNIQYAYYHLVSGEKLEVL